ncbi:ankyrin repeat and IBR domain-containing protein 1-like [Patiria miniata]|uniref:RBR-type E3 ubiquitin transferase n=1 Tax=Patiria miniata TaxID=46514 RepID=A0A914BA99_PATMI|nr:ankyrin repeat and IBR domain-containing protein 1-like [Patiria miniata]
MGSTSSKFRKALYAGDEKVAEELYHGSVEFQKVFDPNSSYGENYSHNTALHYASRHGMHRLVRIFIQRHSGNPNKRNSDNQTSLHCICMEEQIRPPSSTYSYSQYYYSQPPEKKRLECLRLVLVWRGIAMGEGEREQIQIDAEDEDGNTALHYAAGSGYLSLVEMLLEHNASMFVENADKETPCDSAERHQHIDIAQLLESKMVFSSPTNEEEDVEEIGAIQYEEAYSGLRLQELQEAKDLVVVETADMLRVPLFTAEALLRNFEWSREALLECWIQNPEECCEKCGVKPPENLDRFAEEHKLSSLEPKPVTPQEEPIMCDICTSTVPAEEISSDTLCSHQFCRDCWERYLSGKIKEGNAHSIVCPGYDCDRLVPVETIEKLVSREMARRYLQFDINAFVESNPKLKWCPVAGCGRAVQMPQRDPTTPYATSSNRPSGASSPSTPPSISHAVDCGQGHIFCWDCSGDAHEPCCCENWKKWMDKIAEIKPEELASTDSETELAANCLWLVTNSKPCPKCTAPIQKNDGCNHMKCTKCKHDFCWVCQEAWSKHSSETGGYFRCNRFEVVTKVDEKAENLLTDAEKKHREMQELNRFIHFYTRFKNHAHSHSLEEPLLRKAVVKMRKLGTRSGPSGPEATKFIQESILELLRARRILRFSYPYGYYLEDRGGSKQIFEFMQNELEEATETLSQMVARHYLRTPRHKIVQAAQLVLRKRHEFLSAVSKGLLPPDTPPRVPRRPSNLHQPSWESDSDEEDEAFRQAIEASLQEAVAQAESSTAEQQEDSPLSFLDLHLGSHRKTHNSSGNRVVADPGSMTEGLLRALEMSQLLLMQQTEQLQPHDLSSATSTASTNSSNSSSNITVAAGNIGTSAGTSNGANTQVTSSRGLKTSSQNTQANTGQSVEAGLSSSFDEDFRRAIQLSLQELESGMDTDATQTDAQSSLNQLRDLPEYRIKTDSHTSSRTSGSTASSKSRRKKLAAREHKSSKEYARIGKVGSLASKTSSVLGGELPVGGLLDLSQELESEFERIKRKTLSPDEDSQASQGEEKEALKSPWERKSQQKKRTVPNTYVQYPQRASSSSATKSSDSQMSRSNLLSAYYGKTPDEPKSASKNSLGGELSRESEDSVRAVRASSDPYAPAIQSLLTHLESQRAVSAEHVSKAKSEVSKARTSSSGSATPSRADSNRSAGNVAAPEKPTSTPAKPVWLEGPLLAKSKPRKSSERSGEPSFKSAFPKQSCLAASSKPSSLNIELYLSRKATPEEVLRQERAGKTSINVKSEPGSAKLTSSVSRTDKPEPCSAVNKKGAAASESGAFQNKTALPSASGTSSEPEVTVAEPSSTDETPLQGIKDEGSSLNNTSVSSVVDSKPKAAKDRSVDKDSSTDSLVDSGQGKSLQPKTLMSISSLRQGEVKQLDTESPWEVRQSGSTPSPEARAVDSNLSSIDKLSVRATVDKPVWEPKQMTDQASTVDGCGDALPIPSGHSCSLDEPPTSLDSQDTDCSGECKKQDAASSNRIELATAGSTHPIWERGDSRNVDGEEGDNQVWQMFI